MPTFHGEPIYNAAYDASWWPEVGRATLPVQALSMQGRFPTAGFHLNSDEPFYCGRPDNGRSTETGEALNKR